MTNDTMSPIRPWVMELAMMESSEMDSFIRKHSSTLTNKIADTISKYFKNASQPMDRPSRAAVAKILVTIAVLGVEDTGIDVKKFIGDMVEDAIAESAAKRDG